MKRLAIARASLFARGGAADAQDTEIVRVIHAGRLLADPATDDPRSPVAVDGWEPSGPDMRGLDHMVVDAHDPRDVAHDLWWLRSAFYHYL